MVTSLVVPQTKPEWDFWIVDSSHENYFLGEFVPFLYKTLAHHPDDLPHLYNVGVLTKYASTAEAVWELLWEIFYEGLGEEELRLEEGETEEERDERVDEVFSDDWNHLAWQLLQDLKQVLDVWSCPYIDANGERYVANPPVIGVW